MPRSSAGPYTVAGVHYGSQYAYRKALAETQGYASLAAYRRDAHAEMVLARMSRKAQSAYDRALDALSLSRGGKPLTEAAKSAGTTVGTVRRYAGDAVERRGARYVVRESDTLPRRMKLPTPFGTDTVLVGDSREASLLSRYHNAVQKYLRTGDESVLHPFEGQTITVKGRKVALTTDKATLDQMARAGELHIPDIYDRGM